MSLDQGLSDVVHQVQGLQGQNSFLSKQNKLLKEQVIEQQSRYMRENLIFKRIPDTYDPNEDTEAKLKNFIATELEITENVEFHVVHRLKPKPDKSPGGIVAKFERRKDRNKVLKAAFEKLKK